MNRFKGPHSDQGRSVGDKELVTGLRTYRPTDTTLPSTGVERIGDPSEHHTALGSIKTASRDRVILCAPPCIVRADEQKALHHDTRHHPRSDIPY